MNRFIARRVRVLFGAALLVGAGQARAQAAPSEAGPPHTERQEEQAEERAQAEDQALESPDAVEDDGVVQGESAATASEGEAAQDGSAQLAEVVAQHDPSAEESLTEDGPRWSKGVSPRRATAVALTGIAFLGVGVGASYGIEAVSRRRQGEGDWRRARLVSRVAFAVGLASLGGAAYLWLTDSKKVRSRKEAAKTLHWDVIAGPENATAWVGGTF